MARSLCTCGTVVLWKSGEAQSDEWLLAALPDVPDDPLSTPEWWVDLPSAAFCSNCGRLWVGWTDDNNLTEYVPTDPDARPVRQVKRTSAAWVDPFARDDEDPLRP